MITIKNIKATKKAHSNLTCINAYSIEFIIKIIFVHSLFLILLKKPNKMIINYKRIIDREESHYKQLKGVSCDVEYIEISSYDKPISRRSRLQEMLRKLKKNDIVNVENINIIAPDFRNLIKIAETVIQKKAQMYFLQEKLTIKDASYKDIFELYAKFEDDRAKEDRLKGNIQGKKLNHYKGGKPKLNQEDIAMVRKLRSEGIGVHILTKRFNISRNTIYNILNNKYNYNV